MSGSEHLKEVAPFPWKSRKGHSRGRSHPYLYRFVDAHDLTVLLVPGRENTGTGDRAKEIAEYVLRAANFHEELLEAAKDVLRHETTLMSRVEKGKGLSTQVEALLALGEAVIKAEGGKS